MNTDTNPGASDCSANFADSTKIASSDAPYDGSEDSGFGMSDDEMMRRMRGLVRLAIAKQQLLGFPVARFDFQTREAYLEYPDGRREYIT